MELAGYTLERLRVDGNFALYRGGRLGRADQILVLAPSREPQTLADVQRLEHEVSFAGDLDPAWAVRPTRLVRQDERVVLVLDDPGGDPLDAMLGRPLEPAHFLRVAIDLTVALRHIHERGLIHRDIKPANVLWNAEGGARLMGFGFASRVPREQRTPIAPDMIAGTFAYMAPEQTGRMNRSIDARSDLYALGVTFYEMLTGTLPFTAADPMEWIHCHIARPPQPPGERAEGIPDAIEAIVLKLLAKTAEDRYQTAAGLEADLRLCAASLEAGGSIGQFALGTRDVPDRLLVPEQLYGRENEIGRLVAAFERVAAGGRAELVLVSGYSGVGKSSVVNELHKALVPSRGLFAAGKFDQYKRDIPYATLAQAFQSLVRRILGREDAELVRWRRALLEALGPNGQLMVNLIPELAAVVGDRRRPELPPQDAQNRFQMVFRRFLGVFARPEHPLALFLDDLQWLDLATLDLLERLVSESDAQHLLLVGAYRDNEVGPSHPLVRTLKAMREAGGSLEEIVLAPLAPGDVGRLIADTLRTGRSEVQPLAELVFAKTGGNPFFAIQFIAALAEEKLLAFDAATSCWTWDMARIQAKGFTDNVADLMAAKLARLPADTQQALGLLACLGNVAEIATLDKVHGGAEEDVHAALWQAVLAGLVRRTDGTYAFAHDRVHEAAYTLVPANERAMAHLRIGRLLASQTAWEALEENIFDTVNQLDRGAALIVEPREREQVAGFNLIAGKRAKAATAYASALQYFAAGRALLGENSWEDSYRLAFDLELNHAECEYLTAELVLADARLSALSARARTIVNSGAVARLRLNLYTNLDKSVRAIVVGLDFLRQFGVEWLLHPTDADVHQELAEMRLLLAGRPVEHILDLPLMSDPDRLAAMDVLAELLPPARFTDNNLHDLLLLRMTNMSLEHGNCAASCHAYAVLNIVLGLRFGDYQTGFRFSELACVLVDRPGLDRVKARVYMGFGSIALPWTKHLPLGRALILQAFDTANTRGDRSYAVYSSKNLVTNLLISGEPLEKVQLEAERAHAFARKARFGLYVDAASEHLMLIRRLRGLEPDALRAAGAAQDEVRFERHLEEEGERLALVAAWYWIHRMQADLIAGEGAAASGAALRAGDLLWATKSHLEFGEYHFYAALTRAGACNVASGDLREQHLSALFGHREAIAAWARNCPENFANRLALVDAEIARIEGREIDAALHFEEAIRSARAFGFVQNEALSYELAARFYAARGLQMVSDACLRSARDCYLRWGADGKVRQLERANPHLRQGARQASLASITGTPVENLDLATVIKVSQAVSGEIDLKKLIDTLMILALEHAGGDRGLLILPQGDELWIEAQAKVGNESVEVQIRRSRATGLDLPHSVLNYVVRSQDSVLLADISDQSPFSEDEYIVRKRCRSLLCLPLLKQSRLVGVLYLENGQTPHVFTAARMAVLSLLASQAAISLENAHLYADLKRTEAYLAEAQRLSRMGSWVWDLASGRIQLSEEHLRMFGFAPDQLDSSYRLALDGLHPEDRRRVRGIVDAAIRAREDFNCEFRVVMPDGSIKHMHSRGRHVVNEVSGADEYIGTIVDITERKRDEGNMQKLVSLIENSTDFIGYAPTPGQTGYLNAAGRRLVGLGMDEDISKYQASDFLSAESNRTFVEQVLPVLSRVGHWEGELSLRHFRNNSSIPVHQSVSFITQKGSDQPIGIATISRDVTERKRADENLKASLEEKEVLLKEVHHRVKNNLQLISSLLNLQAARIADPVVAEQFAESRNRVRSMALVHENLYRTGNFARVPMRAHIQSLCAHLIRAYGLHSQHVGLASHIDEVELDLDRAISTGLIVNELVSNAFKHAFPDGRRGSILVELKLLEGTRCALTVADDGVGLRSDLALGQTGTMGFQLVHDLAQQLYGVLSVKHGLGTAFRIEFDTLNMKEEMQ